VKLPFRFRADIRRRSVTQFWPVFTLIGIALALCTTSTDAIAAPQSSSPTDQVFGMSTVLAQIHPHGDQWLAVGTVCPRGSVCSNESEEDFVVGGATLVNGQWRVRLLVRYLLGGVGGSDCRTQAAPQLVPGGKTLIAGCLNGGSDGQSFVVVLGFNPSSRLPQVLLSADCGDTTWALNGKVLTIESWDLKNGGAQPSARHPDATFTWEGGTRPNAGLATSSPLFGVDGSTTKPVCQSLSSDAT
jgi:hypothetical protein